MILLQIDGKNEPVWRCQALSSSIQTFRRVRSMDLGTPDRLVTSFSSGPNYYLEVVLTGRILSCWTDSRVEEADVAGIDTKAKTIQLKGGDIVPTRITDRRPTDKEQKLIQRERLIESNNAIAAALNAANKQPATLNQEPVSTPEINETLLWHVQQKILDELDTKLKSAPSASVVFTLYCRDQSTLTEISKKHKWPYRTLKLRKAKLETFLRERFNLTLAAFFVDRSIFSAAERQLQEHRARHISPHALADENNGGDAV
jgi:hypothetical protein